MNNFELLYNWIESWHQKDGYGGFLHHAIHGTVNWEYAGLVPSYTYEPLMNGFINLYEKTGNKLWLDKAENAAHELIAIIDRAGQFKYSGFEFAPKAGSIVHTINPLFAFMRLYKITRNDEYILVCKKVLESVTAVFWRGDNFAGPFNMTLMVAAAIAEYGKVTGDWRLQELYGYKCFELVRSHKVGPEGGLVEGLYYRNENKHDIVFPWYNTVKAQAMIRYGKAVNQSEWIEEGIRLLNRIKLLFRDDYALPHSFQPDESGVFVKVETPVLIAPAAYTVSVMQQHGIMTQNEVNNAISYIVEKQASIGFIPPNEGYDWRSLIGVTAWNCFVFELLSQNMVIEPELSIGLGKYVAEYGNISVYEDDKEFRIKYNENEIVTVQKKTGCIDRKALSYSDFYVKESYVKEAIHLVKLNKQRHYTVSYIDNGGKAIWLEEHEGKQYAWSPYSVFEVSEDGKITYKGKQKYDKFSIILSKVIRPVLYRPKIMYRCMKYLKH